MALCLLLVVFGDSFCWCLCLSVHLPPAAICHLCCPLSASVRLSALPVCLSFCFVLLKLGARGFGFLCTCT